MDAFLEAFMKFRYSPWWYLFVIMPAAYFVGRLYSGSKGEDGKSDKQNERLKKIGLWAIGAPVFLIVILYVGFSIFVKFSS